MGGEGKEEDNKMDKQGCCGLPPQEAPVVIAEKRKLFFSFLQARMTSVVLVIQHELGLQQLGINAVGRDIKHCC